MNKKGYYYYFQRKLLKYDPSPLNERLNLGQFTTAIDCPRNPEGTYIFWSEGFVWSFKNSLRLESDLYLFLLKIRQQKFEYDYECTATWNEIL